MNYDLSTIEGLENAKAWTDALFNGLSDGATWLVPRSMVVIKIHKARRHCEFSSLTNDPSIVRVVEAMGWTVSQADQDIL